MKKFEEDLTREERKERLHKRLARIKGTETEKLTVLTRQVLKAADRSVRRGIKYPVLNESVRTIGSIDRLRRLIIFLDDTRNANRVLTNPKKSVLLDTEVKDE